jgi:diacylglycerol kinase family enzyme
MKARPFRAAIDVDGVRHEIVTTMVSIGNGRFYIPTQVHPPAGADHAARAIVQAPRDDRRLTLLRLALEFGLTGRLPPARLLSMSGREILIEAQPPQVLDVDGEAAGRTPARIAIAYGALRVFAPRPAQQPTLGQKSNLAA